MASFVTFLQVCLRCQPAKMKLRLYTCIGSCQQSFVLAAVAGSVSLLVFCVLKACILVLASRFNVFC